MEKNKYIMGFEEALNIEPVVIRGKQNNKNSRTEEEKALSALSVVNSMTLCGEYLQNDGISKEEEKRVLEFMAYFIKKYGNNEKLFKMIKRNWPDGPRIFRIYNSILDTHEGRFQEEMLELRRKAGKAALAEIKPFSNYICSHKKDRFITYLESNLEPHEYSFKENDQDPKVQEFIEAIFLHAKRYGGIITYRRVEDSDCHVVCTARCTNGKISSVSKREIRESMKNAPKTYGNIVEKYEEFLSK